MDPQITLLLQKISELVAKLTQKQGIDPKYDKNVESARERSGVTQSQKVSEHLSTPEKHRYENIFNVFKKTCGVFTANNCVSITTSDTIKVHVASVDPSVLKGIKHTAPNIKGKAEVETTSKSTSWFKSIGGVFGITAIAGALLLLGKAFTNLSAIGMTEVVAAVTAIGGIIYLVTKALGTITAELCIALTVATVSFAGVIATISLLLVPAMIKLASIDYNKLTPNLKSLGYAIGALTIVIGLMGALPAVSLIGLTAFLGIVATISYILIPALNDLANINEDKVLGGLTSMLSVVGAFGAVVMAIGALMYGTGGIGAVVGAVGLAAVILLVKAIEYILPTIDALAGTYNKYNTIDGAGLIQAAKGITALSLALFGSGIVNVSTAIINKITSFFGGDIVDKFIRFGAAGEPLRVTANSIRDLNIAVARFATDNLTTLANGIKDLYYIAKKYPITDLVKSIGLNAGNIIISNKAAVGFASIAASVGIITSTFSPTAFEGFDKFTAYGTSKEFISTVDKFSQLNDALQGIHKVSESGLSTDIHITSDFTKPLIELSERELRIQQLQLDELIKNNYKMDQLIAGQGNMQYNPNKSTPQLTSTSKFAVKESATRNSFLEAAVYDNNVQIRPTT